MKCRYAVTVASDIDLEELWHKRQAVRFARYNLSPEDVDQMLAAQVMPVLYADEILLMSAASL